MLTDSLSRRGMLRSSILGTMLFPGLLSELMQSDAHASDNPLVPKKPHFKPKAKRVIFLFMTGGVSHVDTFDHKPKLFTDVGRDGMLKGVKVSPEGRVISESEWAAHRDNWLPSEGDRAFVASLMGRVVDPGKFANWIAPPVMGINRQPVDFEYVRFA